jgi:hypothetical protein
MKRRFLPIVIGIPVLAVLLLVYALAKPYILGKQCARERQLASNLLIGFKRPYKPVVIASREQLEETIQNVKRHLTHGRPFHVVNEDILSLAQLEKSLATLDFAAECLILVPVTHGYDDKMGLSAPILRSGKLTLQVWRKDATSVVRHPAGGTGCFAVTVKRELVEEVEILGADGGPASIILSYRPGT